MLKLKNIIEVKLWLGDKMNSIYAFLLLHLHLNNRLIIHQNNYIKKLERHNTIAQSYIARAYIRKAKGHYDRGELIQTIDTCMMAIYTYRYGSTAAYKLCLKAYEILSMNSQQYEGMHFWMQEYLKEQKIHKH